MKTIILLLAFAGALFAQNPSPCTQVRNAAIAGQVLSAATSGRPPQCQWITGGGGGGGIAQVTGTLPIQVANTTTTPVVSCRTATGSVSGCLTAADWTTFNSKAASNASTSVNGQTCTLGSSCTVTVAISTGVTGLGPNVATFLGTPSGANLAAALTSALPNTKGGTGGDSSSSTGFAKVSSGTWSYASILASELPNVNVVISTSGAVSDPGNSADYQFNNASGALTFNVPVGVAGLQRCYRNATGKTGAITLQMATSNTVDVNGANGSSAGTLVSGGALGDAVCLVSDAANHWYAYVQKGTWTNN